MSFTIESEETPEQANSPPKIAVKVEEETYDFSMLPSPIKIYEKSKPPVAPETPYRYHYPDALQFKTILEAISKFISEGTFIITPEGVSLKAMDPSHVLLVSLWMPKEVFQEYHTQNKVAWSCIDIGDALKLIKYTKKDDNIIVERKEEVAAPVKLTLIGELTRHFTVPTLKPTREPTPDPKLEYTAIVKMKTNKLEDITKDLSIVAEQFRLEATREDGGVKFSASPSMGDSGKVDIPIRKDSTALITIDIREDTAAMYGVSFFSEVVKACKKLTPLTNIEYSQDKPCKITPELQGIDLCFHIAPRIE